MHVLMRAETGRPDAQRGFTLIELVVAAGILAVLAMGIIPVAKVASVRADEIELRRSLRTVRMAIDAYREAAEAGEIDPDFIEPDHENYPPDLEDLVEGVPRPRGPDGRAPVLRFLRRAPGDDGPPAHVAHDPAAAFDRQAPPSRFARHGTSFSSASKAPVAHRSHASAGIAPSGPRSAR